MNITKGCYSKEALSSYMGKEMCEAYTRNQDNPNEPLNEHWENIRHPQTGETLYSEKSYCNPKDTTQTYYAQYTDNKGNRYHYVNEKALPSNVRQADAKSINEQLYEDRQEYLKNREKIQAQSENKEQTIKRENGIQR